jgi:glucose-6-phosphate 1-epimerase
MQLDSLNEHFGLPGVLVFRTDGEPGDLIFASITTPHATATVYLQGAHLTAWQPAGHAPVLFTSRDSEVAPGKAIRGGVPIAFPWFATRHDGKPGPSHGFARIQEWTLAFAALSGENLHLTFTLGPTELSRSLGYDQFRLAFELVIGRTLGMKLTVANDAAEPLLFEEALHTYYAVADIHEVNITGLDGVTYLDKTDGFKPKVQHGPVTFTGQTDRVYLDTAGTCVIHDVAGKRSIEVAKVHSNTTVVWNPWDTGAAKLPDLENTEWHEFVAVETVNAAKDAITLAHGATYTMEAHVSVRKLKG